MISATERSFEAAIRVLQGHAQRSQCKLVELELAAWVIGSASGKSPQLPKPTEDLHVRLAAALGSREFDAAESLLNEHIPTTEGDKLLFSACDLAGDLMADRLIDIAYRHPNKWFLGPMLAKTTHPERLLGLFKNRPTLGHAISTVGELVIVGRDAGSPIKEAELLWAEVLRNRLSHTHDARFRDTWLRIAVRESLENAIELLMRLANEFGRGAILDGVTAVLARLVRNDPERAVAIVAGSPDPWDRLDWFEPLKWWFELPPAAEPIVRDLLVVGNPEIDIRLARMLTSAGAPVWLERSLKTAKSQQPLELARDLAPGVSQLRSGSLHEEAERVREQVLPLLPDSAAVPWQIAPRDLFDTLSAPHLPALVPWGSGPGLP